LLPFLQDQSSPSRDVLIQWCQNPNQDAGFLWDGQVRAIFHELGEPAALLAAWTADVRTLVTADGWRYTRSAVGEGELFNLHTDPGETQNIFYHRNQQENVSDCQRRLIAAMRAVDDPQLAVFSQLQSTHA
jgi:hypothetical protein